MAQYIYIKKRKPVKKTEILQELIQVCELLTPSSISIECQNTADIWPGDPNAFYAIQNSESSNKANKAGLLIGWMQPDQVASSTYSSDADGSYAVIKSNEEQVSFFSDQFGSRTLWYYFDDESLIVSTSQRAIVALKGTFKSNEKALAWYLSAGCQGPFISWDEEIYQVLPYLEYHLNVIDWHLETKNKQNLELPASGSTKFDDYLEIFEQQTVRALAKVVGSYPEGQVLLPLSGGLDSRLLLALSKNIGLEDKVSLVNWGAPRLNKVFDDKKAAHQVAKFYNKKLLNKLLPAELDSYNQVLDAFVQANEGRIDHYNAFVDGFKMWSEFFQSGYRVHIRGEMPYPPGWYFNEKQLRSFMGLTMFSDYSNMDKLHVKKYSDLQSETLSKRLEGESLRRWRDRTFTSIRIPMFYGSFADQTSSYIESISPMYSWSLFKLYMGLPDSVKKSKPQIQKLWQKYDLSSIPSNAVGSLNELNSYFDNEQGRKYLLKKLEKLKEGKTFNLNMINVLYNEIEKKQYSIVGNEKTSLFYKVKTWLNNNLPDLPRDYLISKIERELSSVTLAYRVVFAEKIINMYTIDAKHIAGDK